MSILILHSREPCLDDTRKLPAERLFPKKHPVDAEVHNHTLIVDKEDHSFVILSMRIQISEPKSREARC
jgi:hypothetical protein